MSFSIKKYNGKQTTPKGNQSIFYIQCVGEHSGRPMKTPIPNSWEVVTERKTDFQILQCLFISKILKPFLVGSVIPFLRLSDYKNIISPILQNALTHSGELNARYLQIEKIEQNIERQKYSIQLLEQLKHITALKIARELKRENAF